MGGMEKKKSKNRSIKGDIAARKKKKSRRKVADATAKTSEASNAGVLQENQEQVASSLNLGLPCTDSVSLISQKRPKKKRKLKVLQECGHDSKVLFDEASSEKEKKSLLAWVEMSMWPDSSNNVMRDVEGSVKKGHVVSLCDAKSSSNGLVQSLGLCDSGERVCNGDAFVAPCASGACVRLPGAHALKAGHACGKKSSSNGHSFYNSQLATGCSSEGHNSGDCHGQHTHGVRRNTKRSRVSKQVDGSFYDNQLVTGCSSKGHNAGDCHGGHTDGVRINTKRSRVSKQVDGTNQEKSGPVGQSFTFLNGEISVDNHASTHTCRRSVSNGALSCGGNESLSHACALQSYKKRSYDGHIARSGVDVFCHAQALKVTNDNSLLKEADSQLASNCANSHDNKRKREDDKVLQYVLKRCVVVKPTALDASSNKSRTTKTAVVAWGKSIPVTLTSEACAVQEWISTQSGNLFGLDVEWRPNRAKGEKNKVALLQLCNENECLIIQMLFLDRKPQALRKLLSDPLKGLAGVGVLADGKRLLHDYGLECQGGIELTTLAVERLKRDELRNVGLKVLVQEVLGLSLDKPKRVTLSNWAKVKLDPAQISYACMDAWASFALSRKLLVDA